MKVAKTSLESLWKMLNIAQPVEIVDSEEEADKEFSFDKVITDFIENKKPVFQAEFESTILPEKIKAVAGEFGGKLNGFIRKASNNLIPLSDLDGLEDKDKIQKLVEFLNADKNKDTEEIRNQLNDIIAKHEAEVNGIKEIHTKEISDYNQKLNDVYFNDFLMKNVMPNIPLVDGDVNTRINLLKMSLNDQFSTVRNDKGEFELREKTNIEKPIIKDNNIYGIKDFADSFFNDLGIKKIDNRDKGGQGVETSPQTVQKTAGAMSNAEIFAGI